MLKPQFIKLIKTAAESLGITLSLFSDDWAIELTKNDLTKYLVGNTLPLNDSVTYRIVRNKNLCSDILDKHSIANVPHKLLFSPSVLMRRNQSKGNMGELQDFIMRNNFPLIVKLNNTSGGEGVYLVSNEPELENVLSSIYKKESTLCLSPFRTILNEYRCVVLNGKCLLLYEKLRPFVTGDGKKTLFDLIYEFYKSNYEKKEKLEDLFDANLLVKLNCIPKENERTYLQWKHNSSFSTSCLELHNEDILKIALEAAKVINAKFVSVDIIYSRENGYEIMEINASVLLNLFSSMSIENFEKAVQIYSLALREVFPE